nr:olfactory receptor 51Q1 [Cavia porcellus]
MSIFPVGLPLLFLHSSKDLQEHIITADAQESTEDKSIKEHREERLRLEFLHYSSMSANSTQDAFYFILTGIPGFEDCHIWISIPFCCFYIISIIGNTAIYTVVHIEPSLHQPMYLFLSMLALTDLGLTLTTLPTIMGLFWFNIHKISFEACFAQFFFLHGFSFMESSVLLAMAFDRYVAICHPLRYASIFTNEIIGRVGFTIICRCALAVLPSLFLLKRLPFCGSHLLSHSYCLHQDMIHLVCADTQLNNWYGFALVLLIIVMDPLLIVLSYAMILRSVLRISSMTERLRALNNCLSHVLAVMTLYVPMVGVSMTHRFVKHNSPLVHVIMANVYLLAPPVMNPIIYSVKTKQIRHGIIHLLCPHTVHSRK